MIRACPQNHSRNLYAPLCWKWGRYFKLVLKHTSYDTSKEQKEYKMLYFENDYCEGAHEAILKRLLETNMEKVPGYGQDPYCDQAKEKIKAACGCTDGEVYFLVGGTQTNAVVIASMLNRYEGVLSAVTGHVNAHEAGAIEFTGHKVLPLPQKDGKISAADLKNYLETYYADGSYDHMVFAD